MKLTILDKKKHTIVSDVIYTYVCADVEQLILQYVGIMFQGTLELQLRPKQYDISMRWIRDAHLLGPDRILIISILPDVWSIWDTKTGICVNRMSESPYAFLGVIGRQFLSHNNSNDLILDDMKNEPIRFRGHTSTITCIDIYPCQTRFVTGSRDNTLRIWDINTVQCLHTLIGHTDYITCVKRICGVGNNTTIVSGSCDNTVRIWDNNTCTQQIVVGSCDIGHIDTILGFFSDQICIHNTVYVASGVIVKTTLKLSQVSLYNIRSGKWIYRTKPINCTITRIGNSKFAISDTEQYTDDGEPWNPNGACSIIVVDLKSCETLYTIHDPNNHIDYIHELQDGRIITSSDGFDNVNIYDQHTGHIDKIIRTSEFKMLNVLSDGRLVGIEGGYGSREIIISIYN